MGRHGPILTAGLSQFKSLSRHTDPASGEIWTDVGETFLYKMGATLSKNSIFCYLVTPEHQSFK